jgi:hypothetical protein
MADLPEHNPSYPNQQQGFEGIDRPAPEDIVKVLDAYRVEGENARDSGPNPRTPIWENNIDCYWGRYDYSKKADWQSKHVLPEVSQYVDRWAAALREALDASPEFFSVEDDAGGGITAPLIPHITKVMRVLLGRCSRTPDGHYASFSSLFEEQMKLGAMMALDAAVTWKNDVDGGRVSVDSVDPRETWFDPKGRNLYRRRRYEIDKHELVAMASRLDEFGLPIYNMEVISQLGAQVDELMNTNREKSTGSGTGTDQGRTPIIIDEYIATIVLDDGKVVADRSLMIVANDHFLIRGPEKNPYWHNQDWIVFTPMISVPMSIYGRTYMEEWVGTANAFIEMTNLILDAVQTSAMKAYVVQAAMLADPTQLLEGISPNKIFQLDEGVAVADFIKEIELGQLPQEVVVVWQALKNELREGAKLSEIALGQMPNKTHIAAEAVSQAGQSGSAMIRSIAKTIEQRWLEPVLTLVWQTALQYMDFMAIADEIGQETAAMLNAQRADFQKRKIKFRVRGISGLIDRQAKLQAFMGMMQVIAQNPVLLQAFMQKTNLPKLLQTMTVWFGVDPTQYEYTQAELIQQQVQQLIGTLQGGGQQPQQQGSPPRPQSAQ